LEKNCQKALKENPDALGQKLFNFSGFSLNVITSTRHFWQKLAYYSKI